jgi:hypothetical protein
VVLEKEALHQRLREERQRRKDAEADREALVDRFADTVTRSKVSVTRDYDHGDVMASTSMSRAREILHGEDPNP